MLLGGCGLWVVGRGSFCGRSLRYSAGRSFCEILANPTGILGWKPIPSEARVTRDEVSGIK